MRVATVCGSLHSGSTNAAVLAVVADRLVAKGATIDEIDISVDVPAFRPQQVDDPPTVVASLRACFERADGVVVAVPEYAGGAPGWVKNITDWMVGSASLHGRPIAVVSAATAGGDNAIEQMARTFTWQGAPVVATCSVAAPLTKVGDDLVVSDAATRADLELVADELHAAVVGGPDAAFERSLRVLEPWGIDDVVRARIG